MKKFIATFEKPNGKLDKRAMTMFASFVLGSISGIYVVLSDLFLKKEINPYAIGVVGLFFTMATGQAIIATKNKVIDKNLDIDQPTE